nr:hypothetical protein [Tanacetum cinerariifolium]
MSSFKAITTRSWMWIFKWMYEITFGNAGSFLGPSTPLISSSRASSYSGLSGAALSLGNAEYLKLQALNYEDKDTRGKTSHGEASR